MDIQRFCHLGIPIKYQYLPGDQSWYTQVSSFKSLLVLVLDTMQSLIYQSNIGMNSKHWKIYGEKTTFSVQDTQFQTFSGDKTCKSLYNIVAAKIKTACSCYWECSTPLSHLLNFGLDILTTFRYTMHSFNHCRTSLCKIRTFPQSWMHCPAFYILYTEASGSIANQNKFVIGFSWQNHQEIISAHKTHLNTPIWILKSLVLVLSVCLSTVFSDSKALWCSLCLAISRCATGSPCDVSYSTCTTVYIITTNSSNKFNMFISTFLTYDLMTLLDI